MPWFAHLLVRCQISPAIYLQTVFSKKMCLSYSSAHFKIIRLAAGYCLEGTTEHTHMQRKREKAREGMTAQAHLDNMCRRALCTGSRLYAQNVLRMKHWLEGNWQCLCCPFMNWPRLKSTIGISSNWHWLLISSVQANASAFLVSTFWWTPLICSTLSQFQIIKSTFV